MCHPLPSPWRAPLSAALLPAILLSTLPVAAATAQGGPPPVPVEVATAERASMAAVVWVPGTVVSRNDARVAAEVPGRLTWVAEVGDQVAAGADLARIDGEALTLRLRQDEATVKRLEAQLTYLDKQLARLQTLTEQQIAARRQLDEIESQRAMAEQELEQARSVSAQTRHDLDRTHLKAPFAGRVVERLLQPGSYAATGGDVVRLVDTRRIEVRAQAPLEVAPHLREGSTVAVRDDGREANGRVRAAVPVGDERSRMFELRVTLPEAAWPVGAAVRVAVPGSEQRNAVAVPRDALVLRQGVTYLFKVAGDKAERVTVEVGVGEGERIEVRGNVAAGDRVVVRGAERLQPGQAVTVQRAGG